MQLDELAATMDLLIGRSLAQELAIQYLAQQMPEKLYFQPMWQALEDAAHAVRSGPWTDAQLAHFDAETRRISEMLHRAMPSSPTPF